MITIGVTYEVITPETAEEGCLAEQGYEYEPEQWRPRLLKERLKELLGYYVEASCYPFQPGAWWTAYNVNEGTREWFEFGTHRNFALHIDGITDATAHRINRLLTGD